MKSLNVNLKKNYTLHVVEETREEFFIPLIGLIIWGKSKDTERTKWSHFNQTAKNTNIMKVESWGKIPFLSWLAWTLKLFLNFLILSQCLDICPGNPLITSKCSHVQAMWLLPEGLTYTSTWHPLSRPPRHDRTMWYPSSWPLVILKPEKTPAFGLPVTTKPNKQWQRLNLYGSFIQMAGDLRRWWVHSLTDHLLFSFQPSIFITGNKPGTLRGFEIQGGSGRRNCHIPVLGSQQFPGEGGHLPLPETQWPGCLHFSPGGSL